MAEKRTLKRKTSSGTVDIYPETSADNVGVSTISGLSATNVQGALEEIVPQLGGSSGGVTVTSIDVELLDSDTLNVTASGKTVDATLAVTFNGEQENINLSLTFGNTPQSYSVSDSGCSIKISTYKDTRYGAIVEVTDFRPLGNATRAFYFRNNTPAIFQIQASSNSGTCVFYVKGRTITYA